MRNHSSLKMYFVGFKLYVIFRAVAIDNCYPARACASRGYVIRSGVHIYIYMFVDEKNI